MGTFTDWQQRQMDEASGEENSELLASRAVGGITWTTCLAPTESGEPCLKGVPILINGQRTGRTHCDEHQGNAP